MTDNQIIEELRGSRYQRAVNSLYHVFPSVKKHITTNSGTTDDAKDIFQDALVILYKKAQDPAFSLSVPLKTYLQAIVKNLWLQELRKKNRLPVNSEPSDLVDITLEANGNTEVAYAAFKLLGEKCKQLLLLFYFKKKSYREIAAALAFGDEKTAKNQKYRCLQKAKENYQTLSSRNNE